MEQLLSIKHIPIKVEVKVQRAEFKQVENSAPSSAPSIQVSAGQNGGLRLQAQPYKVDLSESRNYDTYVSSAGNSGITLTYQAVATLADGGSSGAAIHGDDSQNHFKTQRASRSIESVLQSLPKSKNSAVSYSDGTLSINYQLSGDSDVASAKDMPAFEFVPGNIEFIISQMPKLEIEYLGDPIYFPRSADPNYEPPLDVHA